MARLLPLLVFLLIAPAAQAAVPGVQAHRGGPVIDGDPLFAEETLPAFRNAHQNLQVVLELDAKLTKDSVPVVFHDDTLDRTTNCTGLVADKTLAELAACPADVLGAPGNDLKTAPAPTPVPIATLAEVLAYAKSAGATVNLEIKNYPTDDDHDPTPAFANRVMDVVLESKIPASQVILQSFTPQNLDVAEQRMPEAEFAFLGLAGSEDFALSVASMRGWDWVSPAWPVDKEFVDRAHAEKVRVVPYTINQREDVKAAADGRRRRADHRRPADGAEDARHHAAAREVQGAGHEAGRGPAHRQAARARDDERARDRRVQRAAHRKGRSARRSSGSGRPDRARWSSG